MDRKMRAIGLHKYTDPVTQTERGEKRLVVIHNDLAISSTKKIEK